MIEVRGLKKTFDGFAALDGADLSVPRGAVYGLVGPNGAGKTTLLRHLTGVYHQDSGSVTFDGQPVWENADVKARIASIPDDWFYFMQAGLRDMMRFYRGLYPKFDQERFEKLREVFALDEKRPLRRMSKGQQKQAAFWLALCTMPDYLILDEPVNGLDPEGIIEMRELILRLNRERQITVLISSHILDELARLATHYGFIDGGRMVREMSAAELEAACRKSMRLEVTDTGALARVLDAMGADYRILSEDTADVYERLNVSQLAAALAREGCELVSVKERDESLESFYISIVGGGARHV